MRIAIAQLAAENDWSSCTCVALQIVGISKSWARTVKSTLGSRKFHYLGTSQAHIRWVFGVRFFLVTRWNEVLGACEVALHVEGGCCEVRGRFNFVL